MSKKWTKEAIASTIDHTILKATAQPHQVEQLCREAIEYKFASVCVNPCYTKLVSERLKKFGCQDLYSRRFSPGSKYH